MAYDRSNKTGLRKQPFQFQLQLGPEQKLFASSSRAKLVADSMVRGLLAGTIHLLVLAASESSRALAKSSDLFPKARGRTRK